MPENSLAAFCRADVEGLPFELDVRLARDGTPVVFHDATLSRMAGSPGRIEELTIADLDRYRLRTREGATDEGIPTLDAVLEATRGAVLIELKRGREEARALVEGVLRVLHRHPRTAERVALQSFDPETVAWIRAVDPSFFRCQLIPRHGLRTPMRFARRLAAASRPHALAVNLAWAPRRAVKHWKRAGLVVLVWTAKTPRDFHRAARLGADRLITDYVPGSA